jgi:hypothetical protein
VPEKISHGCPSRTGCGADAWCGTGLDEPAFPYARSQKREIVFAVTVRIAD